MVVVVWMGCCGGGPSASCRCELSDRESTVVEGERFGGRRPEVERPVSVEALFGKVELGPGLLRVSTPLRKAFTTRICKRDVGETRM